MEKIYINFDSADYCQPSIHIFSNFTYILTKASVNFYQSYGIYMASKTSKTIYSIYET